MNSVTTMRGRVFRAMGAEGLGQLLNIAIRLLLVPLFLSAWGTQSYGEWLILTAVAGWFSLADIGGQLYFINRMTETWTKRQLVDFQKVFSTGMFFFSAFSAALMISAGLLIMLPDVPKWLGIESTSTNIAQWVLLIMCFRVLASLPSGLLLGVYRATGAQATSVMYGNLMLAIQLMASAAVLWWRGGMILMALTEVVGLLLVSLLAAFDLRRRMPDGVSLFSARAPDIKILKQAWAPSLHFLGIQLAMAIMIQGSVIVVAKAMGPFEVAVFSTMRTIANVVSRFLGMMSHSAWPEFTRLYSKHESKRLQGLFCTIFWVSTMAGVLYLALLQHFGAKLFNLWLNKQLPYDSLSMFLMGALVVFTNNWTLGGNLLMATNRHKNYAQVQLPVNIMALSLSYFCGQWFGMEGLICGLLVGQSIPMLFFTAWMLHRNEWKEASNYLFWQSILVVLLLPFFVSSWWGGAIITAMVIGTLHLWNLLHRKNF